MNDEFENTVTIQEDKPFTINENTLKITMPFRMQIS
jgi:hypothetical protein